MKVKHYIALGLIVFLLLSVVNLDVLGAGGRPAPAPKPPSPPKPLNPPQRPPSNNPSPSGGSSGGSSGSDSGTAAEAPDVAELNWQADSLSAAVNTATHDKKVAFVYFYFKDKEDFPANYDTKLQKLSNETYLFAKIFVATDKDKNGRMFISDGNAEFFDKNKLPQSTIAVALDPYGNLLDKLVPPMSAPKIIPFMENADKKYKYILNDLNGRYEKADKMLSEIESAPEKDKEVKKMKLIPEAAKTLLSVVNGGYEGYPVIEKANGKLGELDAEGRVEYLKLMKEYAAMDKELRDPKSVIPGMEKVVKIYKGLPVEQEIRDAMKDVKEKNIPEKAARELEKPAPEKETKDSHPEEHQEQGNK
ncbi:MAG: hypothetical protein AB1599_10170 [Planctomycetota bacterium]